MVWTGWEQWDPVDDRRAGEVLAALSHGVPQVFGGATLAGAVGVRPSFLRSHEVVRLEIVRSRGTGAVFALVGDDTVAWLNGDSAPIHDVNAVEGLVLRDDDVEDYLRYFLYFLRADGNSFVLVDPATPVSAADDSPDAAAELDLVRSSARALERGPDDAEGRATFACTLVSGGGLFGARFAVTRSGDGAGEVEMIDDTPLGGVDRLSLPAYPVLALEPVGGWVAPDGFERDGAPVLGVHPDRGEASREPSGPKLPPRDREVTEAIVRVLLEEAFRDFAARESPTSTLLRHFNITSVVDSPIDDLQKLVRESLPVVIIESDIPFVEEAVAAILDGDRQVVSGGAIAKALEVPGDEFRCAVRYEDRSVRLHLLSFHAYTTVWSVERAANELAMGEAAVLIGCDRREAVPEPLRRVNDMVLEFPRLDGRLFARIFENVFREPPPAGWDDPDPGWAAHLVPADFHRPAHLRMSAAVALADLRRRATERRASRYPEGGPDLADLHGLGEARQIAEDLITDIRAATSDPPRIGWDAVDRGFLLVGAPGTGKTTLARALARASGITFVSASASAWQSAGALDAHLRAMRADFAEARRNAPAILFVDEIDSVGSRENADDRNALYQTEVVNALLSEMQGMDATRPVIVIGATNDAERVDPALRRAGRLDQVVTVPLPNVAGLEKIFEHHLREHRAEGRLDPGVDLRTVAELCLGLTGADVEFFVRGAFRRARRAGRELIGQDDLVAEVTRRPRRADSAPPLRPEARHRVAVHEAGHAVADLTSSSGGADLTFVTIVPRLDGSLGFVASVPADDRVVTRRVLVERIETALAGRAAEEIVFGRDEVGTGAGGPSPGCDLAAATRMASMLVCQAGLGDDGSVLWTEQPDDAQLVQVRTVLDTAYRSVLERLRRNADLHGRLVTVLEEKQEISGPELRRLLAEAG